MVWWAGEDGEGRRRGEVVVVKLLRGGGGGGGVGAGGGRREVRGGGCGEWWTWTGRAAGAARGRGKPVEPRWVAAARFRRAAATGLGGPVGFGRGWAARGFVCAGAARGGGGGGGGGAGLGK